MQKTIISTKVGGVGMLVKDAYNGYTINIGDMEDLANKINNLLDDKDNIKLMGENLYNDVKYNFSSKSMAKKHIEIYSEIIKVWG